MVFFFDKSVRSCFPIIFFIIFLFFGIPCDKSLSSCEYQYPTVSGLQIVDSNITKYIIYIVIYIGRKHSTEYVWVVEFPFGIANPLGRLFCFPFDKTLVESFSSLIFRISLAVNGWQACKVVDSSLLQNSRFSVLAYQSHYAAKCMGVFCMNQMIR